MTLVNDRLIDAIAEARRQTLLAYRDPTRVLCPPMQPLEVLDDLRQIATVESIFGMKVRVDDRIPMGVLIVASGLHGGPVVVLEGVTGEGGIGITESAAFPATQGPEREKNRAKNAQSDIKEGPDGPQHP